MAKHFSENERQIIKKRLLSEGKELFEKYGVKKTSVDQIIEKVGIAKGSFYNFYSSKESMLFDLLMNIEMEIHKEEMNCLNKLIIEYEFPDAMRKIILKLLSIIENEPLLLMSKDPRLIQGIWSKISEEEKERSILQDENRVNDYINVANQAGYKLASSIKVFEASLKSFFFVYINQNMIGESCNEALELMIKAIFEKIFIKG